MARQRKFAVVRRMTVLAALLPPNENVNFRVASGSFLYFSIRRKGQLSFFVSGGSGSISDLQQSTSYAAGHTSLVRHSMPTKYQSQKSRPDV